MAELNLTELREVAEAGYRLNLHDLRALLDRVAELEDRLQAQEAELGTLLGIERAKVARVEALRQAAEVVVLDAGDDATVPEPDPNLAELAHCLAALTGESDD